MTPDGLLMEGPTSKAKFADAIMHIEFLLPFQPYDRGQGRANHLAHQGADAGAPAGELV